MRKPIPASTGPTEADHLDRPGSQSLRASSSSARINLALSELVRLLARQSAAEQVRSVAGDERTKASASDNPQAEKNIRT